MKTISRLDLYGNLLYFILNKSKAYKEGIVYKRDAEKFADELSKELAKQNYYIEREVK